MRFHAFRALCPPPEFAEDVASPPYDVVDTDQARVLADGNAKSFLHIVRPEIDLPEGTDLYSDAVYDKANENFLNFQSEGWLVKDSAPCYYLYRQQLGSHCQTGIVGVCHADEYVNNVIKKHEFTLKKKEDDRTRHVKTLRANAGPVFLTYRDEAAIDAYVAEHTALEPTYVFDAEDGVRHTAWRVEDAETLQNLFAAVPNAYVADGHHRSASAVRVAEESAAANSNHNGEELYNRYLCVLFPETQLNVLAYNRVVKDLGDLTPEAFLTRVGESFTVAETDEAAPESAGSFCLFVGKKWYCLTWNTDPDADPVARLDVSVLQEKLLRDILGIEDVKTDPRIYFVGGIHGTRKLEEEVESGRGAVAFSLYPVAVRQMMDVADADQVMPPKSTWFEPKLRSGLFVNQLDA